MLAVLLSSCCAFATPAQVDVYPLLEAQRNFAWKLACEAKHEDCSGVVPPYVAFAIMEPGLFGFNYNQTHVVVINMDLMGTDAGMVVMLHEMIHVIQSAQDAEHQYVISKAESCRREREAFDLTYTINTKLHITEYYDVAPPWIEREKGYGC